MQCSKEWLPRQIYLVAGTRVQNAALCELLARRLQASGKIIDRLPGNGNVPMLVARTLFLIDCANHIPDHVGELVATAGRCDNRAAKVLVALFNVNNEIESFVLERYLDWPQLRGIFASNCSTEGLVKGLGAIFAGDYWIPRRYFHSLLSRVHRGVSPAGDNLKLTSKEMQILEFVATGGTNADIAAQLSISPHTVKTHIYNAYKKINVSNRIEAVKWFHRHAESLSYRSQTEDRCVLSVTGRGLRD